MSGYLSHHGILGMKWGKRNGPPYPLEADQKSAAEKRHTYNLSKRKVKKEMKYMTDKELQQALNRLDMQRRVDQMNPSFIELGRQEARKLIADVALAGAAVLSLKTLSKAFSSGVKLLPRP